MKIEQIQEHDLTDKRGSYTTFRFVSASHDAELTVNPDGKFFLLSGNSEPREFDYLDVIAALINQ